ncbi:competence type IV pilus minor pilin ComGG [Guptibacillus hwajinpoensis]|uniref:competence type IV pilus minor pilin ComGG n=1 Tax=Guptibacillus hwajinpoensis TaxID=208199 RepID=UPI00384C5E0A
MDRKKSALYFKCLINLNEKGYMTAMMMLISTLLLGFVFHLWNMTQNERVFLDREEEEIKKQTLLVLGMKDTISYIQKTGGSSAEKTFTYDEGTVRAVINASSDVLQITLSATTDNGIRVAASFQYNQMMKQVVEWSEGST